MSALDELDERCVRPWTPGSKSAGWLDGRRMKATPSAMMSSIYLERREPARNRQRFYAILVTPTLFGAWAMVREWGWIGHPGTVRETWFATETAAIQAGAAMHQRKERRGYRALTVTEQTNNNPAP